MDASPPGPCTPGNERRSLQIGPITLTLTVAVMLLLDLVLLFTIDDSWPSLGWLVWLGLTFGQASALAVWVFSHRIKHRLTATVVAIVGGAILALLTSQIGGSSDFEETMLFVALFLLVQCFVLGVLSLVHLRSNRFDGRRHTPQFGTRHLLASMICIAVAGTIIRYNIQTVLEVFGSLWETQIAILLISWGLSSVAAGMLLLDRKPNLGRLSAFALVGLPIGVVANWLAGEEGYLTIHVALMLTLAISLIVPQFDKYRLQVTFELCKDEHPAPQQDAVSGNTHDTSDCMTPNS